MKHKTNSLTIQDETLRDLPSKPGVYIMKNRSAQVIYVGKAGDLKKRVRSYFTGSLDVKTRFLVRKISDIEYIITKTEYEALILENNLIKKWKPYYNINLKDGKTYPVIRITSEEFPRIFRTRRVVQDGSRYYGPYPKIHGIDRYLELIDKLFPLRKCKGPLKKRKHPCLYYHIGRCGAPCCGTIDREEYRKRVESIEKLLSRDTGSVIEDLERKMKTAAEEQRYEKAAFYRDSIESIHIVEAEQNVQDFDTDARDYVVCVCNEGHFVFAVFQMRSGKLFGTEVFRSRTLTREEDAVLEFIMLYYRKGHAPPDTVFLENSHDLTVAAEYLTGELGFSVSVRSAEDRRDRAVLRLARENALQEMEKWNRRLEQDELLKEMKELLSLSRMPRRIEGFDIAQIEGKHQVASMVSFYNGHPDKKQYRRFHITSHGNTVDDYESIREAVARRYTRVLNEGMEEPDLILVDGGKGQVSAARGILKALNLDHIPLLGLAKKEEELFRPDEKEPLRLPESSDVLRLLQHVRDEAHRFATTFNKHLRKKDIFLTTLQSLPGIGAKRSKLLLQTYGSLDEIARQDSMAVAELLKIGKDRAQEITDTIGKIRKEKPGTITP